MMPRTLNKMLQPLYRSIRLLIRRGVLTGSNSEPMMQILQVQLTPDLTIEMEHFESYGFTSRPKDGSEPIVVNVEGKSHPVTLCVADRRYRLKNLVKGEVALYDDLGQAVHLTRDGIVIKSNKITFDAPLSEFMGDVTIKGIDFITHVHQENNVSGPTGEPE